jgi:excisionase family DNA binding protein
MAIPKETLSVAQTAALCGVGRSTVGYWIRSTRLRANRTGKNYSIPREELLFFLKSTGRNIPDDLAGGDFRGPCFRAIQNCWDYWKDSHHGLNCKDCTVFANKVEVCFTAKEISSSNCPGSCHECRYYTEIYLPRIQFVHQIDLPAAVYKGFELLGGNRGWAELCEVEEKDLPGMGIEQGVHPDSIGTVISSVKRRALGDPSVPRTYSIFLRSSQNVRISVRISVYPLSEPAGSYLILAESNED